jgi:hypothetical protein
MPCEEMKTAEESIVKDIEMWLEEWEIRDRSFFPHR